MYLARPAGFEPTTPWFVAKYSIQLSYGRIETGPIIAKCVDWKEYWADKEGLGMLFFGLPAER